MKIAITGANGYIGSHTTKVLLDAGHSVIAIDIKNDNIDPRAKYLELDIFSDIDNLFEKLEKPDVVLHLACKDVPKHNSPWHIESISRNFNMIKELIDDGLGHIITIGSMHDIGYFEGKITEDTPTNPQTFYGISKDALRRAVKAYAKEKNAIHQHLRFFYTYGDDLKSSGSVFSKILQMAQAGEKSFPFTEGKNEFDYIEINELAEQIVAVAEQKEITGIIHCCSGKPTAIKDQVEYFIKLHNLDIKPDFGKYPTRPYDSPCIYGDNSKIQKILKNRK